MKQIKTVSLVVIAFCIMFIYCACTLTDTGEITPTGVPTPTPAPNGALTPTPTMTPDNTTPGETTPGIVTPGDVTPEGATPTPVALEQSKALMSLLPISQGYEWKYSGFAESGHQMELKEIIKSNSATIYKIDGIVDDASGKNKNTRFSMTYTVKDNSLLQEKSAPRTMLESKFNKIELIVTPLESGTTWIQEQTDMSGNIVRLKSEITNVKSENNTKLYYVKYSDENSDYFEKRIIKEGVGVISFEKLYKTNETSTEIGYMLYE